ncbi:MAG: anaerobic ribonucleoside-triphosphate reductase activating protein [Peptoniphilaceae bacterium]|nr:anaerobic ribonucleoside-triphosphate reductase activating protein [Peptoniphilaceae bacterium]MCI6659996.1 anaerobic ribonucleoside-triphosphate reductase activating protein [Peptoniphilaceae bacterium]MDD7434347.1 anaerobic ribonucleoside-triphosphate reductase activating protein [Peptoniphilaceae bacterium]MDD7542820.1 anaerobic ribonucleoside-triphosphate reductase activating protein [Peptoniphilaceae bacterium]MDY3076338.1 anaerobic ribonucleoside-triphosphate reductase activating prote
MRICGLQKMTLLDYPGKVACAVFLGGCDLRCPYCHNAEILDGRAPEVISREDFLSFLDSRKGKLDGVCVTGGEPTLSADLPAFLREIREKGFPVKLDTNGTHPAMVEELVEAGLVQAIAMDIKNSPERYAQTVGRADWNMEPIFKSVELLKAWSGQGKIDLEFRTTVVAELHDEASFQVIGPWISGAPRYFLQQYISRPQVPCQELTPPTEEKMEKYRKILLPYLPTELRLG